MIDKTLYKNYRFELSSVNNNADVSKHLLAEYKRLDSDALSDIERRQLRNRYEQLNDEINNNFDKEKDAIHQLVCEMKPTHLQTITFCYNKYDSPYSERICLKTLEVYLKKLNKKLFHRRKDIQLSVMPFQETSSSQNIHFHLLLKDPQEHINKKIDFEEICLSVLRTMKCVDKVNANNPKAFIKLDYKEERFRNPTFYCLKDSNKINDLPIVFDLMHYC